jgi:c-di-GMP-binding flagellar brake protein YcgR
MFQDTRPAPLGDETHQDWSPFRVDSDVEIAGLLRQLRDAGTPMVLSAPDGAAVVCELWSIDSDQQRINFTAEVRDPALQQLVDADEAVAVGYLDSVKLQFDLLDLLLVRGPSSSALQARLPSVLYRFQRRNAYRVRTLDRQSPTARLRHPAIPDMQLALRVIDVSIGGCALLLPADVPALEPGLTLRGVVLELDADTRFAVTVQIQHLSALQGDERMRVGCEWRTLEPDAQRVLQRYIDQTQKRRRLLSLD